MEAQSNHRINGFSIFTLIVFIVVNVLVVFPIRIPLPRPLTRALVTLFRKLRILNTPPTSSSTSRSSPHLQASTSTTPNPPAGTARATDPGGNQDQDQDQDPEEDDLLEKRYHFPITLSTAPVIGVLLLLASTSIPGDVVRTGIVGSGGVKPYDIRTLFISLAYISLSLDCTGLLRYMAFWVSLKGGTSGRRLYLFFFLFFFFFGVIVGNDPIILSGTSFLAYFSRIAGISPPRAWIFMQFASCNIASAVLVSSNPTNLVLTGAYDVSFLVYSAWTVLPVLATGFVLFPILVWGVFRDKEDQLIPRRLETPDVDPKTALIDKNGAIFGSVLLGVTLALLVGLSAGGLLHGVQGVWTVTAPAAIVMLARDLWYDMKKFKKGGPSGDGPGGADGGAGVDELELQGMDDLSGSKGVVEAGKAPKPVSNGSIQVPEEVHSNGKAETSMTMRRRNSGMNPTSVTLSSPITRNTSISLPPSTSSTPLKTQLHRKRTFQSTFQAIPRHFPTFTHVFVRLPLPLLPFAFSMFILVEALSYVGWIRVFGGWWTSWVEVAGLAGAIFLMGVLSVLGCNAFGTNIGATILLSRVLQQWSNNANNIVSNRVLYGSLYTLALGSNYGAFSYTFSASLAGLLWKSILAQKGIQVGRWEFAKNNAVIVLVCMIVGCLVVAAEVCVMYDD